MTVSSVQEVLDEIVTVLRANMTDPLAYRIKKGENWIISKFPVYTPETPYIKVSFVSSFLNALAIGTAGYRQDAIFQVTIASTEGEELDVNDDGVKEKCAEIAEYFATQVINITNNQRTSFTKPWIIRVENQNRFSRKGIYYMTLDLKTLIER